jgi:hypothetical protein
MSPVRAQGAQVDRVSCVLFWVFDPDPKRDR